MAKDPLVLLLEVDELLSYPASPASVKKALTFLKKHEREKLLRSYWAKALVLSGQPEEALVMVDDALAFSEAAWPHFWRAAALVMTGARPATWAKELRLAWRGDKDVAAEALRQPAFEAVRGNAAFLAAIGRKPGEAGPSAAVMKLVALAEDAEPYALFKAASKLAKEKDQASVLDAQLRALGDICDDLDEHGDANLDLYGNQPASFFRAARTKAKAARKALGRDRSAFGRRVS